MLKVNIKSNIVTLLVDWSYNRANIKPFFTFVLGPFMPNQMHRGPPHEMGRFPMHPYHQQNRPLYDSPRFNNNNNQQNRQWNRRDDNRYTPSYDNEVIRLPPSYLMTSREKEWLVKIQLMALLSDDMHKADYYFIVCTFFVHLSTSC